MLRYGKSLDVLRTMVSSPPKIESTMCSPSEPEYDFDSDLEDGEDEQPQQLESPNTGPGNACVPITWQGDRLLMSTGRTVRHAGIVRHGLWKTYVAILQSYVSAC